MSFCKYQHCYIVVVVAGAAAAGAAAAAAAAAADSGGKVALAMAQTCFIIRRC